jgi:hypothetical protein
MRFSTEYSPQFGQTLNMEELLGTAPLTGEKGGTT